VPDANPVIVHPSCVQTAVMALNVSCPVRATRSCRPGASRSAALPTFASGDPESMLRVIRPPLIGAVTVESEGVLPPPPGLVGLLLLPQPSIREAIVTNEIA